MSTKSAIVIGAGIVGLATARALAKRNYRVTVIERNQHATGASIRNFGMIWPIGQAEGRQLDQAMLSRQIWLETCRDAKIWCDPVGSLHVAYSREELAVLEELHDSWKDRKCRLMTPGETKAISPAVEPKHLLGGLFNPDELIVDPRKAISSIPQWLNETFGVKFIWATAAREIRNAEVLTGAKSYKADEIYVCTGADFETLYPDLFLAQPITKCKLQMMKLQKQPAALRIGPALCGGLSLLHYNSFKSASSLKQLQAAMERKHPEYLKLGIHVMVSQNESGELIVGDSHEYGLSPEPFNSNVINELILAYLKTFASFKDETVIETWNGVYAKLVNGDCSLVLNPEDGVTIINGLGGAGMTLSFGLCEQVVANSLRSLSIQG